VRVWPARLLQTYSVGSCGLLCKSRPHAVIRWFNVFLTKERVSRGRRRHNEWVFEVFVQGIHLPSNPFLLLQIFNCNYPQRSWIVAKINLRMCARDYLIRHSFATGILWYSTIILANCKFGNCIGNSPIRQIKALAKVSTYTVPFFSLAFWPQTITKLTLKITLLVVKKLLHII